jgi:superfamily II DNA/RNA helicase
MDLPDITTVIQYDIPSDLPTLVQRMGRGSRDFLTRCRAIIMIDTNKLPASNRPAGKVKKEEGAQLATKGEEAKEVIDQADPNPVIKTEELPIEIHTHYVEDENQGECAEEGNMALPDQGTAPSTKSKPNGGNGKRPIEDAVIEFVTPSNAIKKPLCRLRQFYQYFGLEKLRNFLVSLYHIMSRTDTIYCYSASRELLFPLQPTRFTRG